MPFDINEDRRLRMTWNKYQNDLYAMKHRNKHATISKMLHGYTITKIVNEEQDDGTFAQHSETYMEPPMCSTAEEAEEMFEKEVWKMEQECRAEMKKIQAVVRAEKKIQKEQEKREKEREADEKSKRAEELRAAREQRNVAQAARPVRRSRRLAKKRGDIIDVWAGMRLK